MKKNNISTLKRSNPERDIGVSQTCFQIILTNCIGTKTGELVKIISQQISNFESFSASRPSQDMDMNISKALGEVS